MHVNQILNEKGRAVATVQVQVSLLEVARILAEKRIGAVVVLRPDQSIAGIVSERDLVRVLGKHGPAAMSLPLTEVMTHDVVTCREQETIDELMALMTSRRIRHLPVVEADRLVGIISIGDVVKHRVAEVELEAMAMRDYIAAA
jgi:CBS domain-containing protein